MESSPGKPRSGAAKIIRALLKERQGGRSDYSLRNFRIFCGCGGWCCRDPRGRMILEKMSSAAAVEAELVRGRHEFGDVRIELANEARIARSSTRAGQGNDELRSSDGGGDQRYVDL